MHDKKKKSQLIPEDEIKTNQQKERIKKAFSILQELFNKKSQCDLYKKLLNSKDISPKILLQNEDFFDEPDFNDSSALAISEELLAIYPEFTPIWNYRRFLLLTKFFSIRKNEKVKTFVKLPIYGDIETSLSLLVEELCLIQRLFRHTCKNYGIWYHRWYIVEVLCRLFTTLDHKKTLFQSELDIVESLLVKDDRNFYCWNYRQLLLNLLLETSDSAPSLDKTIFSILSHTGFVCFLKQHVKGIQCIPAQQIVSYYQLYTSSKMINRNISNYSAWHLRMKYFTQSSTQSDQEMQEELSFVETAFYTDPNNSGVWNYYKFYVFRKASQMTHDYPNLIHAWPNFTQTSCSSTWALKNIYLFFSQRTLIRNVCEYEKKQNIQWYPYTSKLLPSQSQHRKDEIKPSLNIFPVFQDIQRKESPFETHVVYASMCWIGVMESPINILEEVVTLPVCIEDRKSSVRSYYFHIQKNSGSDTESVTWSLNSSKVVPDLKNFVTLQNATKDSRIRQWIFLCDEIQRCKKLLDVDSTFYKYPLMIIYWIFEELHKLYYRLPLSVISSWCEKNLYYIITTDASKQHRYLSQLQTELLTKVSRQDSIRQNLYDDFLRKLSLWNVTFTSLHEATIDFDVFSSYDPALLTLLNPAIQKYRIKTSPTSTRSFNIASFFLSCETQEIDLSFSNCSNLSQLLVSLPYCEALPSLERLNLTGSTLSESFESCNTSKGVSKKSLNTSVILRLVRDFRFPLPKTIFITNTPLAETCQELSQEERQTVFFPYTVHFESE